MPITRLGLNGFGVKRTGDFSGRKPSVHPVGIITKLGLNGYGVTRGNFSGKQLITSSGVRRLLLSRYMTQCRQIDWGLPFGLAPLDKQEKKLARKARREGLAVEAGEHSLVLIDTTEPVLVIKKHTVQKRVPLSLIPELLEEQEIIMILLLE